MITVAEDEMSISNGSEEMERRISGIESELARVDPSLLWAIEAIDLPADGGEAIADATRAGNG